MKKLITLLLTFIMCISLCACGGSKSSEETPEDIVRSKCMADVSIECAFSYKDVKTPIVNIVTVSKNGTDNYLCQGKVTIIDNYGDKYAGNFTAEYSYNENSKTARKENLDIDTPRKQ
ncbi:MAG: hypothetical protein IJT23_09470 [Clostridia bacterium]|nr:hypothetical protein [Clostridia bacterium]